MKKKEREDPHMRLPVNATKMHKGKTLEVDHEQETITLLDPSGQRLGTVTWESVIEHIRASTGKVAPVHARAHPRASLLIRVRYRSLSGQQIEGRASGIGGGGLYLESTAPLPVGSELAIQFALPEHPNEWLEAKATVAWVCPKADQYTFFPGMGVRFVEIATETRERVLDLVRSLKQTKPQT
jgi:type IV pilus assembly protein PilZ